uniref:Uncharacterized protein n=1 Tax=Arundo donax TaxID=35708 RepID=A0A0A9D5Z6_ARUDO
MAAEDWSQGSGGW